MKLNKKFKAYTIAEILVVLVITAIVVGLALSVLSLVQKQMTALQYNEENNLALKTLETRLFIDFNTHDKILIKSPDKLLMINTKDTLLMSLAQQYIIINQDTTRLNLKSYKTYFEGQEKQNGYIDALELNIEINKNISKPLFIFKQNDADSKLNAWE